jgi:hypothetical protein
VKKEEQATPKRAAYRPIKQLRAFADALWLVADPAIKEAKSVRLTGRTPQGYNILVVNETDKDGYNSIVAYANKRGVKAAYLGVIERRAKTTKKYKVRVILRPIALEVDATSREDAVKVAKVILSEDNDRNPLLNARYMAKEAGK